MHLREEHVFCATWVDVEPGASVSVSKLPRRQQVTEAHPPPETGICLPGRANDSRTVVDALITFMTGPGPRRRVDSAVLVVAVVP